MHDAFLAIDTDVRLGSEIVLAAFLGLMHLRIALLLAVLGRRRGGNDGRVHDGTGGDADALAFQIQVHRIQDLAIQLMLLKKMAEVENRGLVGRGAAAQIDSGKAPQHGRFVERILGAGIGEVEPVLQKIDAQHDRQAYRLTAFARLRIVRPNQCLQFRPRNDGFHRVQELFTAALAGILLKTRLAGKCYLAHRVL